MVNTTQSSPGDYMQSSLAPLSAQRGPTKRSAQARVEWVVRPAGFTRSSIQPYDTTLYCAPLAVVILVWNNAGPVQARHGLREVPYTPVRVHRAVGYVPGNW